MKLYVTTSLLLAVLSAGKVSAFTSASRSSLLSPAPLTSYQHSRVHETTSSPQCFQRLRPESSASPLLAQATDDNGDEGGFFSDLTINPGYAAFWLAFVSVATYMSATEPSGASQALIESFVADPLHPGFGSSLFESVWNCIGLVGLPLATVIMPGAKGQKLNPTPFLIGSSIAGYGSLGPFMMTRKPVPSVVNVEEDLGWFTKNVLENKIFNWALFVALANAYVISGAAESLLANPIGTFEEFGSMISGSALGTATTVDFTILCLVGASLVPEDLKRRGLDADYNGKVYAIAASTLLIPAAGLALYSALRPSLIDGK
uniref:Uncharacterized protein n=1 Tax=Pseudictyota dubia TaxID=2749911 RepID=A0A7R9ZAC0_9STRA|mmetsp:Transcript_319/g.360  ORF Transcript_319/g.360 Transcript_319/m.360 type:complete len:318 (+) Transcript_319:53-1006(+)